MRVQVYRNLTGKCLSVMALEGPMKGRIIDRPQRIMLSNCQFIVRQSGRRKVLKEHRKNVHAFVKGEGCWPSPIHDGVWITYNPYKYSSFVRTNTLRPVKSAKRVKIWADGRILADRPRRS